jgi:signal transduction histidine kinase
VDAGLAHQLKTATGGSDFVFLTGGKVTASTLDAKAESSLHNAAAAQERVTIGNSEYYQFAQTLTDIEGHPLGELRILRSFEGALERIAGMRTRLAVLWFGGVLLGLGLTYLLARRLLKPVEALDLAAAEIAQGNYAVRVGIESRDEIGRLAQTFNSMCASISTAREDLIRQERISTIGRLSTSIIHDLRNPLAAIYGGAEMLVDSQLSPPQVQRLSQNIYRSSRQIQDMLQELADVTQGRAHVREVCRLREIVQAACEPLMEAAETNRVHVKIDVADEVEVPVDRSRMERVFQNLISNAIEAMPQGGSVRVHADRRNGEVVVSVEDNGPGIPGEISDKLFQPFVTSGKNNGMGLGLALSRTTVLSHGGDLWAERAAPGARFLMRLPALTAG